MFLERIDIKLNNTKIKDHITQIEGSNRWGGKIELVYYNDKPCFNIYISKTNKINAKTEHKLQNEPNSQYIYVDCIQNELAEKIFKLYNNKEITKYYLTINTNSNENDAECIIAFHKEDEIKNDKDIKKQEKDYYKKWWFWLIIGILLIIAIGLIISSFISAKNNKDIEQNNIIVTEPEIKNTINTTSDNVSTEQVETKEQYVSSCVEYTFKEIARTPNNYVNKRAKFTGEVIQIQEENGIAVIRLNITKDEYGYYDDTIMVGYQYKDSNESRILEEDIITVYGELQGNTSYESVMGVEITLPLILANYIDIN